MGKGVDSFGEGWKGSKSDEDSNLGGAGSKFMQNSGNQLDYICEKLDAKLSTKLKGHLNIFPLSLYLQKCKLKKLLEKKDSAKMQNHGLNMLF